MKAAALDRIADEVLGGIRERGTHRRMRVLDGLQAPRMRVDGREVLLFAGSNYLDLAGHPEVAHALGGADGSPASETEAVMRRLVDRIGRAPSGLPSGPR